MSTHDRVSFRGGAHMDWYLFVAIVVILTGGLVNLYSATSVYEGAARNAGLADIWVSQVYWIFVGLLFGSLIAAIDYRQLERFAYFLYVGGLLSLGLVFVFGTDIRGSARWIKLGSFNFQPSEFMKIVVILAVAKYLHNDPKTEPRNLIDLAPPTLLTLLPIAAVMLQPDLGTSLIYAVCAVTMLSMTRVRSSSMAALVAGAGITVPVAWLYLLKDYQKARITSFLDPEHDKTGTGWHALQSRTAIGNGGLLGEGYMQGTQNQFGFLPEQHSDFPFAVFAEDWGFVGCLLLLAFYCFVCTWSVRIASQAKDRFGAAVAVGVGAMFFAHVVFNVGMATGLLPVVGVTLPLFSYGGSSIVTMFMGLGLLMSVSIRS